jgi:hypothetical protein
MIDPNLKGDGDEDYNPLIKTKRFDIFHHHVTRNPQLGFGRDVYEAWPHSQDQPRSVCEVTLCGNYVEWIHVCEIERRQGIATEVMLALEGVIGCLEADGVTESGIGFCDYYCKLTNSETEATEQ